MLLDHLTEKRILIIAPHNDDEVIGCWFLMRKLSARAKITVAVATAHVKRPDLAETRRAETREALSRAGISDIQYWKIPDNCADCCDDKIDNNLRSANSQWDYILCPAPNDRTPDHGAIAKRACLTIADHKLIWYRSTWWTFTGRNADFSVEGSFADKKSAIELFKSQRNIALLRTLHLSLVENLLRGKMPRPAELFLFANRDRLAKNPLNSISLYHFPRILYWR